MSLLADALRTEYFSCPYCRAQVSSEASGCPSCAIVFGEDFKQYCLARERRAKIEQSLRHHRNTMYAGAVFLALSGFLITLGVGCGTFWFITAGVFALIKGFVNYREEKRKLKNA